MPIYQTPSEPQSLRALDWLNFFLATSGQAWPVSSRSISRRHSTGLPSDRVAMAP